MMLTEQFTTQDDEGPQLETKDGKPGGSLEEDTAPTAEDDDDEQNNDDDDGAEFNELEEDGGDDDEDGDDEDGGDDDEDQDDEVEGPADKEARLRAELAAAEQRCGPGHLDLVQPLTALITHLFEQGRVADAEAASRRMLAILEEHEGPGARRTAVCRHYIHLLLFRLERYDEAAALLKQVIAHYRKTEGPKSFDVAWSLHELANLRNRQGHPKKALALSRRALRMAAQTAAPRAPRTLSLLHLTGLLRLQVGESDQAVRLFRIVLSRCQRAGDTTADIRARVTDSLGLALEIIAAEHKEAGRTAEAAALARELIGMGRTSGHLLAAELLQGNGEIVEAQRVLEAGVLLAPQGGRLWGVLGDLYVKQGLLGDGARAYDRALCCPDAEIGRVHFQAGLLSQKRDSPLEAIEHFAKVQPDQVDKTQGNLVWEARNHRMVLLRQVGRIPEALALAGEVVSATSAAGPGPHEEESDTASLVCLGRALLYLYRDRTAARACALQAFRVAPDALGLGLLREIDALPLEAKRTRCLRVTVNGRRRDRQEEPGRPFARTYLVVADSLQEALSFIRALEEGDGAGPISLREWSYLEVPVVGLRGVHSVSDYRDLP